MIELAAHVSDEAGVLAAVHRCRLSAFFTRHTLRLGGADIPESEVAALSPLEGCLEGRIGNVTPESASEACRYDFPASILSVHEHASDKPPVNVYVLSGDLNQARERQDSRKYPRLLTKWLSGLRRVHPVEADTDSACR